jgi:hypothetical protein
LDKSGHLDKKGDGDEDGEDEHSSKAIQVKRPSPRSVHEHYGHQRHTHHDCSNTYRRKLGVCIIQSCPFEQCGGKLEHLQIINQFIIYLPKFVFN